MLLYLNTRTDLPDGSWTVQTNDGAGLAAGQTYEHDTLGWYTLTHVQHGLRWLGTETTPFHLYTLTCRPATAEEIAAREALTLEQEREDAAWRAGALERFWLVSFGDTLPNSLRKAERDA